MAAPRAPIVGPSDMRAKMGPMVSSPGVPLYQTAPDMVGYMAEHESQGMSGFDYAMIGRMQRMEAGLPAVDLERSFRREPAPLAKSDVSFDFLLHMSDDFLAKADEVLAILGDD